jgi:hypothetical protein
MPQAYTGDLPVSQPGDRDEAEADGVADAVLNSHTPVTPACRIVPAIQRQPRKTCPTNVDFSQEQPVHAPPCGPMQATSNVSPVSWSLLSDTAPVTRGTQIAANGSITIAPAQRAGEILVHAGDPIDCNFERPLSIRSQPTGITSTKMTGPLADASTKYGAQFSHVLTSADGKAASLHNVAVGERFIGVPNPAGDTHNVATPFGAPTTVTTGTLEDDASNSWSLTSAGELTPDSVGVDRDIANVGKFVKSASTPTPLGKLPVDFSLKQGLHWFCPQAPSGRRWRIPAFFTVTQSHKLQDRGGIVEFVTTVNGEPKVESYTGATAVFKAKATPAKTSRSAAAPAAPNTVAISVETLPAQVQAGAVTYSIAGNDRGCSIVGDPKDPHTAVLTVGTTPGSVTVHAEDATGTNFDRVPVAIT